MHKLIKDCTQGATAIIRDTLYTSTFCNHTNPYECTNTHDIVVHLSLQLHVARTHVGVASASEHLQARATMLDFMKLLARVGPGSFKRTRFKFLCPQETQGEEASFGHEYLQ